MLGNLTGKVALVTGGGSGLGRGIAWVLGGCGADVAIADLDHDGAGKVACEISELERRSQAFQVDVTNAAKVHEAVHKVLRKLGQIDVLVDAAGVIGASGYETTTTSREEDWDVTYSVNVMGTVLI